MPEDPSDVPLGYLGEVVLIIRVEKGIPFPLEQGLMGVHPAAVYPENGLGHEGGIDSILIGYLLDHDPVGHHVVGHGEGILKPQIDLMLGGGNFVVAILHLDPHGLQGQNRLPPQIPRGIEGREVEIPPLIQCLRVLGRLKVEILELRPHVEGVSHPPQPLQIPLQDIPGIALVGRPIGIQDVAEHPGHGLLLGPPGDELKGNGVRPGQHIALVDSGKPLDG